jgi:hypothetical protein
MANHSARLAETLRDSAAPINGYDAWIDHDRFTALRALYTTERVLIEFLLGDPVDKPWCANCYRSSKQAIGAKCKRCGEIVAAADDITPGCFLPSATAKFPFGVLEQGSGEAATLEQVLVQRRWDTNKQIAHLTWPAVTSPRSWTYSKNENVVKGLTLFATAIDAEGLPATTLRKHIAAAARVWRRVPEFV